MMRAIKFQQTVIPHISASSDRKGRGEKILVAGATGQLGARVLRELRARGYWTRALVRDAGRLREVRDIDGVDDETAAAPRQSAGAASVLADDVFVGDATRPETLGGVCDGIDVIVSTLGAPLTVALSKGRDDYRGVDYLGNKHLLDRAVEAGVKKFVYVSVFGADRYGGLEYVRAHEDFVRELRASSLDYAVVRPTGFFSAFAEILRMARKGRVALVGEGDKRTNPIHESDLAAVCGDAVEDARREYRGGRAGDLRPEGGHRAGVRRAREKAENNEGAGGRVQASA
ncbi:MAG: SDR family oxidoreductase, partial [Pyrinomonadaceae bacterium]